MAYEPPFTLDEICRDIASGKTFAAVAADCLCSDMTLRRWIMGDPVRAAAFAAARQERAHKLFDDTVALLEEAMECRDKVKIQAYKLKVDTLKWMIGKMNPKEYGEKQQIEHSGVIENRTDEQVRQRLDQLLAKAQGREG